MQAYRLQTESNGLHGLMSSWATMNVLQDEVLGVPL